MKASLLRQTSLLLGCAALLTTQARAGLPEPGARVFGSVAVAGVVVTAADASIVVEARATPTGPAVASYQMGSKPQAGNFYTLSLNADTALPLTEPGNVLLGSTIYLVVRNGTTDIDQKSFILAERGSMVRVNFGAVDTDGDGMSDEFEVRYFGSATGGDPGLDPDHDGRPNLREFLQGTDPNTADGRHPADIAPADDRISLTELTDYIFAWKTGATWPIEPSLSSANIEDYVTRAGALWKGGEAYIFKNVPATTAPLWWVNPPVSPDQTKKPGKESPVAQDPTPISVARTLPVTYFANVASPVGIVVTPTETTLAYAVVETPPNGWTVRNMSDDGRWDAANQKIKWGPFFDTVQRTLTYEAVPPTGTLGILTFVGRGSFDGTGYATTGATRISPVGGTPEIRLTLTRSGDGSLALSLVGEPGRTYELQTSTALPTWTIDSTVTLDGAGHFTVPVVATGSPRFFQLRFNH